MYNSLTYYWLHSLGSVENRRFLTKFETLTGECDYWHVTAVIMISDHLSMSISVSFEAERTDKCTLPYSF